MQRFKSGFTLIELLVVIAIIAILAAILFPVFAQAKMAAKKTRALSAVKQIGTALHIYVTDHDDTTPSVYDGAPGGGDPPVTMAPYIKNEDIWYSDERTDRDGSGNRRRAFGYNWGFEIRGAGGMVGQEICSRNGGTPVGCSGNRVNPGYSMTYFEEPARLFAFGDTYDTPRMTMGAVDDWNTEQLNKSLGDNSRIRYGGRYNVSYADGHAKAVAWKVGKADSPAGWTSVPKNYEERLNGYCAQKDAMIIPFIRSGNTTPIACRDIVALPEVYNVQWWRN